MHLEQAPPSPQRHTRSMLARAFLLDPMNRRLEAPSRNAGSLQLLAIPGCADRASFDSAAGSSTGIDLPEPLAAGFDPLQTWSLPSDDGQKRANDCGSAFWQPLGDSRRLTRGWGCSGAYGHALARRSNPGPDRYEKPGPGDAVAEGGQLPRRLRTSSRLSVNIPFRTANCHPAVVIIHPPPTTPQPARPTPRPTAPGPTLSGSASRAQCR